MFNFTQFNSKLTPTVEIRLIFLHHHRFTIAPKRTQFLYPLIAKPFQCQFSLLLKFSVQMFVKVELALSTSLRVFVVPTGNYTLIPGQLLCNYKCHKQNPQNWKCQLEVDRQFKYLTNLKLTYIVSCNWCSRNFRKLLLDSNLFFFDTQVGIRATLNISTSSCGFTGVSKVVLLYCGNEILYSNLLTLNYENSLFFKWKMVNNLSTIRP